MPTSSLRIEESLAQLVPVALENFRVTRYRGDDLSVSIEDFSRGDRERVCGLYHIIQRLFEDFSSRQTEMGMVRLAAFLRGPRLEEMLDIAGQLGRETFAANPSRQLGKAIHDLRGGGLTPLLGVLQCASLRGFNAETPNLLFYLTRDHLKITRSILTGLDEARRAEDLRPKSHSTRLILEKWQGTKLQEYGREVTLTVDCRLTASIGACCMEFGALDRICYNLINNACRHSADDLVKFAIMAVPDKEGRNLRFLVSNRLTAEDSARLSDADLSRLFRDGVSSTGSGCGLAIVSEFVSHAYGLPTCGDAVRGRYVCAALLEDSFVAWFHWPRVLEQ